MSDAFDDSALIHGGVYDPAKAREYYLRTRQLKGRPAASVKSSTTPRRSSSGNSPRPKASFSQREELEARKAALEKRLDRLREVLASLVDAAKKRSGIDKPKTKDASSPETKDTKETKSKSSKTDKPLTEADKREKREDYRKEQGATLSKDVQQLKSQVRDIQGMIKKAMADAQRKQSSKPNDQTASNGR